MQHKHKRAHPERIGFTAMRFLLYSHGLRKISGLIDIGAF